MGLFHRREQQISETLYLVSHGQGDTRLIIGLGNPGKKYDLTRHNVGFLCVDALATNENASWIPSKKFKADICEIRLGQTKVILAKPHTFMNLSGEAVQAIQHFYKVSNDKTIVVHDELDIPFGQIRSRMGGSAAGHNGIKSLITHIGEDFGRVRVGIFNETAKTIDSADFVLQKFSKDEQGQLKPLKNEVQAMLNEAVFGASLGAETRSFL